MTPLRILFVSHVPLVRELGGGRVQLELADELRVLGHSVQTFDPRDAFPSGDGWRQRYLPNEFARAARRFVRRRRRDFDVIDAQQGNLPYTKDELGFDGLLVARSVGLYELYDDFAHYARERWPQLIPGSAAAQALARWRARHHRAACRRSIELADLAILPTEEEARYVRESFGVEFGVALPFGLGNRAIRKFADARPEAARRLADKEVVFVGGWSLRKGSADWGAIVARTRALVPGVRFRFLGTGRPAEVVLRDVGREHSESVTVVPRYDWDELPRLLAQGTVGALPSYAEGWGFSVLEQLAAGLPTVAYDTPGPRAMLAAVDHGCLVESGDTEVFAEALRRLLTLDDAAYRQLSERGAERARAFTWPAIAAATLAAYEDGIERVGGAVRAA